nr:MAG TPA: hypothetical protein [Caudoviricetes sp.]
MHSITYNWYIFKIKYRFNITSSWIISIFPFSCILIISYRSFRCFLIFYSRCTFRIFWSISPLPIRKLRIRILSFFVLLHFISKLLEFHNQYLSFYLLKY